MFLTTVTLFSVLITYHQMALTPTTKEDQITRATTTTANASLLVAQAAKHANNKLLDDSNKSDASSTSSSDVVMLVHSLPSENDAAPIARQEAACDDKTPVENVEHDHNDQIAATNTSKEVANVLKQHATHLEELLKAAEREAQTSNQDHWRFQPPAQRERTAPGETRRAFNEVPSRSINPIPYLHIVRLLAENSISVSSVESGEINASTIEAENAMFVHLLLGGRTNEIAVDEIYPESLQQLHDAMIELDRLNERHAAVDLRVKGGKYALQKISSEIAIQRNVIATLKKDALKQRVHMTAEAIKVVMRECERIRKAYKRVEKAANESPEARRLRLAAAAAAKKTVRKRPAAQAIDGDNDDDEKLEQCEAKLRGAQQELVDDIAAIAALKQAKQIAKHPAFDELTANDPSAPAELPFPSIVGARGDPFPQPVSDATRWQCIEQYSAARHIEPPCSVCDQLCNTNTSHIVPLTWAPLAVLVPPANADLPPPIVDYYRVPAPHVHAGIMLAPQAYVDDTGKSVPASVQARVRACSECHAALSAKKPAVPRDAIANGFWVGPVAPELEALTFAEQRVTALVIPKAAVTQLSKSGGGAGSLALRGRVSFYNARPVAVDVQWPAPRDDVKEQSTVVVVFANHKVDLTKLPQLREYVVNLQRITDAFTLLRKQNHHYAGVQFNQQQWQQYLDNVNEPLCNVEQIDEANVSAEARFEAAALPNGEQESDTNAGERAAAAPPVITGVAEPAHRLNGSPTTDAWLRDAAGPAAADGAHNLRAANGERVAHLAGELFKGKNWDALAFPFLVAFGRGGIDEPVRHVRVARSRAVSNLLNHSSHRFARCPSFVFAAFDTVRIERLMRATSIAVRATHFEEVDQNVVLGVPDIINALDREQARKNARIARGDNDDGDGDGSATELGVAAQAADKLLAAAHITSAADSWQGAMRLNMRNMVTALHTQYGIPTFFVTVNLSDVNDPFRLVMSGGQLDVGNNDAIRQFVDQNKHSMYMDAVRDPSACLHAVAQSFCAFVQHVLLGGAYGKVRMLCFSVECQCRGSLHFHGLLWIEGAPLSNNALQSWLHAADVSDAAQCAAATVQRRQELCAFHDGVVQSSRPAQTPAPTPALAQLEHTDDQNVLSTRIISDEWNTLTQAERTHRINELARHIARAVQMHPTGHAEVCRKKNAKGNEQVECRFYFPLPECAAATHVGPGARCRCAAPPADAGVVAAATTAAANEDELAAQLAELLCIHPHRDNASTWLNPFNVVASIVLRCNNDAKMVLGNNSAAAAYYITKYITKPTDHDFAAAVAVAAEKAIPRAVVRNPQLAGGQLLAKMAYGLAAWINSSSDSVQISVVAALSTTLSIAGRSPWGSLTVPQAPGELLTPVQFANLPIRQAMAFLRGNEMELNVSLAGLTTRPEKQDQKEPGDTFKLASMLLDYVHRSPQLERFSLQRFAAEMVVVPVRFARGRAPIWHLLEQHPRARTHVIQQREHAVVAVPRGVSYLPSADAPDARARNLRALIITAMHVPFRKPIDDRGDPQLPRTGVRRIVESDNDDYLHFESFADALERVAPELTERDRSQISNMDAYSDGRRAARADAARRRADASDGAVDDSADQPADAPTARTKQKQPNADAPLVGAPAVDAVCEALFGAEHAANASDDDDEDEVGLIALADDDEYGDVAAPTAAHTTAVPLVVLPDWLTRRHKTRDGLKQAKTAQNKMQPCAPFPDLKPTDVLHKLVDGLVVDGGAAPTTVPPIVERDAKNLQLLQSAAAVCELLDTGANADESRDAVRTLLQSVSENLNTEQRIAFDLLAERAIEQFCWLARHRRQLHLDTDETPAAPATPFPPAITVLMLGEGGTGKSFVVLALQRLFALLDQSAAMRTTAFMASAAVLINGETMHSLFGINGHTQRVNAAGDAALERRLGAVRFIVVDEISAVSAALFGRSLDQLRRLARMQSTQVGGLLHGQLDEINHAHGFVNLLVCGDFGQLLPPNASLMDLMFYDVNGTKGAKPKTKSAMELAQIRARGQHLLRNTPYCVQLTKQHRVTDDRSAATLARLRAHRCDAADAALLNERRIDPRDVNFAPRLERWCVEHMLQCDQSEARGSVLIVTNNARRLVLNRMVFRLWARYNPSAQVMVFSSTDSMRYATAESARNNRTLRDLRNRRDRDGDHNDDHNDDDAVVDDDDNDEGKDGNNQQSMHIDGDVVELEVVQQLQAAMLGMPSSATGEVPTALQIAVGVPITINVNQGKNCTAVGTTRNATGVVVAVIPNPASVVTKLRGMHYYDRPPQAIMIRLDGKLQSQLKVDGLPDGCVLVWPRTHEFKLPPAVVRQARAAAGLRGDGPAVVVKRFGLSVEAGAWATTDYKTQGKTMRFALYWPESGEPKFYVPCSRTPSLDQLNIIAAQPLSVALLNGNAAAPDREHMAAFMRSFNERVRVLLVAQFSKHGFGLSAAAANTATTTTTDTTTTTTTTSTTTTTKAATATSTTTSAPPTARKRSAATLLGAAKPPKVPASSNSARLPTSGPPPELARSVLLARWNRNSCCTDQLMGFMHLVLGSSGEAQRGLEAVRVALLESGGAQLALNASLFLTENSEFQDYDRYHELFCLLFGAIADEDLDPMQQPPTVVRRSGPWYPLRERLHMIVAPDNDGRVSSHEVVPFVVLALAALWQCGSSTPDVPALCAEILGSLPSLGLGPTDGIATFLSQRLANVLGGHWPQFVLLTVDQVFSRLRPTSTALVLPDDPAFNNHHNVAPLRTAVVNDDGVVIWYSLSLVTFYEPEQYRGHFFAQYVVTPARAAVLNIAPGVWHSDLLVSNGAVECYKRWTEEMASAFEQCGDAATVFPMLDMIRNSVEPDMQPLRCFAQYLLYERDP